MNRLNSCYAIITKDDVEFEVEFSYRPGTPDVLYMPNGDHGYPGDPPELEIIKLTLWGVNLIEVIPDDELNKIELYLEENIEEYIDDDYKQ